MNIEELSIPLIPSVSISTNPINNLINNELYNTVLANQVVMMSLLEKILARIEEK